jgi:hypothetical protein
MSGREIATAPPRYVRKFRPQEVLTDGRARDRDPPPSTALGSARRARRRARARSTVAPLVALQVRHMTPRSRSTTRSVGAHGCAGRFQPGQTGPWRSRCACRRRMGCCLQPGWWRVAAGPRARRRARAWSGQRAPPGSARLGQPGSRQGRRTMGGEGSWVGAMRIGMGATIPARGRSVRAGSLLRVSAGPSSGRPWDIGPRIPCRC